MHSRSKETKHIKTLTPEITLETPMWGKPAKRGFIVARKENITTAKTQKFLTENFSQHSALLLNKSTQLEKIVRPN
jgi:hypothetical protein